MALASGALVACLVVALRLAGVLDGLLGLAVLVLALLVAPTSRELSRRVLFGALLAAGLLPALWWIRLPIEPALIALTMGTAASAAAVTFVVRRDGWRRALPRARAVDLLPPAAAVAGLVAAGRWIFVDTPTQALANLMPGWDNSGHFDMFRMIWVHGITIDALPVPSPGDEWHYHDYPQGFHATAATLAQIAWPNAIDDVGASLLAYSRISTLLVIGGASVVVAGVCALPGLRRRAHLAAPLSALVVAAFLLGPGLDGMRAGFAAFVYPAAVLAATIPLVAMLRRAATPLLIAAACSALVLVAHGWALMLIIAVPVVVAAALPLRRTYWRATWWRWAQTAGVTLVGLAGVAKALSILLSGGEGQSLTMPGGITPPPYGPTVIVSAALVGVAAMLAGRGGRVYRHVRVRAVALSLSVVLVGATAVLLAHAQIDVHGTIQYYTWKFLLAWLFVGVGIVATLAGCLPRGTHPLRRASPVVASPLAGAALSVAALQVFGYVGPLAPEINLISSDVTSTGGRQFSLTVESLVPAADQMLSAVQVLDPPALGDALLLLPESSPLNPISAQQWFLSLSGTWTRDSNASSLDLSMDQTDVAGTVWVARTWLIEHPGTLVVPPELYRSVIDDDVLDASQSNRLATWLG